MALTVAPMVRSGQHIFVVADAPNGADAMTVSVGIKNRGYGGDCDGLADLTITKGGSIVLSRGLHPIQVRGCSGRASIPYAAFAVDNGAYEVHIDFNGKQATGFATVTKTVNWIYVRSFEDENVAGPDSVRIDAALGSVQGAPLTSGIFTTGDLIVEIFLEQCDPEPPVTTPVPLPPLPPPLATPACGSDGQSAHMSVYRNTFRVESRAGYTIILPFQQLQNPVDPSRRAPEGLYNVTATFNNLEAYANVAVPMDPTVYREDPPASWFHLVWEE